jgi:hypothetical protein
MNPTCVRCGGIFLAFVLGIGVACLWNRTPTALADVAQPNSTGGPHYTVVETEGHNLLVTDNATNTFYFYTVDRGKEPGAELKLRAKLDLKQVGQPTITPIAVNIQKP